ncbi:MAG TPA: plastocyanin/azurin family copper-binding protein [Actinomycetota bacterium]|nr:plastocyanin/azurin family copper-binding protein [Actinomycetota bacterium]
MRPRRRGLTVAAAVALAALAACDAPGPRAGAAAERGDEARGDEARREVSAAVAAAPEGARPRRVDPRNGGFEVVLGEWAVTPEARAIRPGQVTFVVHNRGTMGHGYEMELEGDSSGPGSGDLFEAESEVVGPGETTRLTVTLAPGIYEIECLVDGHDDMGMEGVLEVRADAPLVEVGQRQRPGRVAIRDFAFDPAAATVPAGAEVTWHNDDPAEHTVTSVDGGFGSDTLAPGASFSHRFTDPGVYRYRCAIHPEMEGQVRVE